MKSGIYCIKNTVTGKVYIGSAVNLRKRKNEHFSTLAAGTHFNRYLQSAYDKYGVAVFEFVVLELVPDKAGLTEAEQRFIDEHRAFGAGYNLRPSASSMLGFKQPDHVKRAVSRAHTGRVWSKEVVAKRVAGNIESGGLERMRLKKKGSNQSPEWVAKRVAGMIATGGRARSAAALVGRKQSAETIRKRTGHYAGRKLPAGWCENISKGKMGGKRPDIKAWASEKFSKFNASQVAAMRADRSAGLTYQGIADKWKCTLSTAYLAVKGKGAFYAKCA